MALLHLLDDIHIGRMVRREVQKYPFGSMQSAIRLMDLTSQEKMAYYRIFDKNDSVWKRIVTFLQKRKRVRP